MTAFTPTAAQRASLALGDSRMEYDYRRGTLVIRCVPMERGGGNRSARYAGAAAQAKDVRPITLGTPPSITVAQYRALLKRP
jgi:hypothetical protein